MDFVDTVRILMDPKSLDPVWIRIRPVPDPSLRIIDVKTFFTFFFYSGHVFTFLTFFILPTFFIFKNVN